MSEAPTDATPIRPRAHILTSHRARSHIPIANTDNVYNAGSNETVQKWLVEIIRQLSLPKTRYPVLVHCKSGKDRTGVVLAALLLQLGYSDEDIMTDFLRTPRAVAKKLRSTLRALRSEQGGFLRLGVDKSRLVQRLRTAGNEAGPSPSVGRRAGDIKAGRDLCLQSESGASDGTESSKSVDHGPFTYLDQKSMANLDKELMSTHAFALEQLMELAGLSVAAAVLDKYPPKPIQANVLVLCGPGNNGGDGLVAARHLWQFGYRPVVVYPRGPSNAKTPHFRGLIKQTTDLGVPVTTDMPQDISPFSIIVDALFGFSFRGTPRAPYDTVISQVNRSNNTVVSVDVPSGWHVEKGNAEGVCIRQPDMLVSLTAPKLCAKTFTGRYHMLGGRFIPPAIVNKYKLNLPRYRGASQCVEMRDREKNARPAAAL